jgi:hypothetical protein
MLRTGNNLGRAQAAVGTIINLFEFTANKVYVTNLPVA